MFGDARCTTFFADTMAKIVYCFSPVLVPARLNCINNLPLAQGLPVFLIPHSILRGRQY